MKKYIIIHNWSFGNGEEGHYEVSFFDYDEALSRFKYLQFLMENDEYDFDAHFSTINGDSKTFCVYENTHSLVNRQDLVLRTVEVSL